MSIKHRSIVPLSMFLLIALSFATGVLSQEPQPRAYWPLNEGSGDVAHDAIGTNDGKFVGDGVTWVSGKFGNALRFDGSADYIEIPGVPELEPTDSVTLSAWVKIEAMTGEQTIASYGDSYVLMYGGKYTNFGSYIHSAAGWTDSKGQTPVALNEWHFAAMTYDGNEVKTYVNGQFDGAAAAPGVIDYLAHKFWIGGADTGDNWWLTGAVDEVVIWNKAMTVEEVMKEFITPSAVSPKNSLIITWGRLKVR